MSSRVARRLDALAARHQLDPVARDRLAVLLDALSRPEAPTAVHEPAQGVDIHLADALVALDLPEVRVATTVADLGAGAGLPGLALAIARPDARIALVESGSRKCGFLTGVIEALDLVNAEVVCARVEEWRGGVGAVDVACARALASLAVLCEYAAPLLVDDGVLVAWKGAVDPAEAADGAAAASRLGLEPDRVEAVTPFRAAQHRTLHVYRKVAPTPPGYPRRAGMAVKRPISAP